MQVGLREISGRVALDQQHGFEAPATAERHARAAAGLVLDRRDVVLAAYASPIDSWRNADQRGTRHSASRGCPDRPPQVAAVDDDSQQLQSMVVIKPGD